MKLKPKAWIPNEVGFKLTVVLLDGQHVPTEVVLKDHGAAGWLHALKDTPITQVQGWYETLA